MSHGTVNQSVNTINTWPFNRSSVFPCMTEMLCVCVRLFSALLSPPPCRWWASVCVCFSAFTPTRHCCGCGKQLVAFMVRRRMRTMAANLSDAHLVDHPRWLWKQLLQVKYGFISHLSSTVTVMEAYRCHAIEIKINQYYSFCHNKHRAE